MDVIYTQVRWNGEAGYGEGRPKSVFKTRTFCSRPSILDRPLCDKYSSSRLMRCSRFSIFVIRFDCSERILSEVNVDRFW